MRLFLTNSAFCAGVILMAATGIGVATLILIGAVEILWSYIKQSKDIADIAFEVLKRKKKNRIKKSG